MSRIEFEFRPIQIINPGWIDSNAKLNSAKINTLKHKIIMTEENCGFVIIYLFDSAHVKYCVWFKVDSQPFFPRWTRREKLLSQSELDRPFWIDSDAVLHMDLIYWIHFGSCFPASRGLFSVVFAELTGARKRDLCPGLKRTVLSMRHGYLATKPSHDAMLLCGLILWQWSNCKRMRERQWAEVTVSKQYREYAFCKCRPRLRTAVESKSISTQGRGLFSSRPSVQRIQRKRGLC